MVRDLSSFISKTNYLHFLFIKTTVNMIEDAELDFSTKQNPRQSLKGQNDLTNQDKW